MEVIAVSIGVLIAVILWKLLAKLSQVHTELELTNFYFQSLSEKLQHHSQDRLAQIKHRENVEKGLSSLIKITSEVESGKSTLVFLNEKVDAIKHLVSVKLADDLKAKRLEEMSNLRLAIKDFETAQELNDLVSRQSFDSK